MKQKLIQLAKEKGFEREDILYYPFHNVITDDSYYLWLCLLQKWLREDNGIQAMVYSYSYSATYEYGPVTIKDPKAGALSYDLQKSHDEALEIACYEALKLI